MKNEKNITEQMSTVNRMLTPPPLGLSISIRFEQGWGEEVIGMGGLFVRRGLTNSAQMMVSFFLKS